MTANIVFLLSWNFWLAALSLSKAIRLPPSHVNGESLDRTFYGCGQFFIRSHNETLSVIAMRVCNPDRSPVGINR
jgi:hypothetical protein